MESGTEFDAVVARGGPECSTPAVLAASHGHEALALEKEPFAPLSDR